MTIELLSKLKKLQKVRGDDSAFADHNDFLKWSDSVSPLLEFDGPVHKDFLFWSRHVKSAHSMGNDHPEAISESIGIVNQAITKLTVSGRPSQTNIEAPEVPFPEKLTIRWLYKHAPLSWWAWFAGLLISTFLMGIAFTNTPLYELLQTKSESQIEKSDDLADSKELWTKNWEYLKNERLNRKSRDCSGIAGGLKVYDRGPIVNSLESLSLDSEPELSALRNSLLQDLQSAPITTMTDCPTLGDFPDIDLLMTNQLKSKWSMLKVEIKAKASSAGVDLTFRWDV
jgi:hypothetical protein